MASLFEQYRPATLDGIVGQDKAVAQARRVLSRSWGGRAWWITGESGTGKTSIAHAIAKLGASDFFIEEVDASTLTPAALREIEQQMRYRALDQLPGKAYIVNECHGLRKDTIRLLLVLLERLPEHVVFIFTTTKAGQEFLFDVNDAGDAQPLVSRCIELSLENGERTQKAFAARAKEIAQAEGVDGLPETVYARAVSKCKGNFRQLLQRIESGAFRDDATADLERDLASLASTKGEYAEQRRTALRAVLASLKCI